MRTIADNARLFKVDRETVKQWGSTFADYLSAAPKKGATRYFTESDTRVFALVNHYWEDEPDLEHIQALLNSGEHNVTSRQEQSLFSLLEEPAGKE